MNGGLLKINNDNLQLIRALSTEAQKGSEINIVYLGS